MRNEQTTKEWIIYCTNKYVRSLREKRLGCAMAAKRAGQRGRRARKIEKKKDAGSDRISPAAKSTVLFYNECDSDACAIFDQLALGVACGRLAMSLTGDDNNNKRG